MGYHTVFGLNPSSSFGVIVLTSGPSTQTIPLSNLVYSHFQPVFDRITKELAAQRLVGNWVYADKLCNVSIIIDEGSFYVDSYTINGTDVLKTIQPDGISQRSALWATDKNQFWCVFLPF